MQKVYGYCRVSLASQVEKTSLDAQRSKIEAWAMSQGLEVAEVYTDAGISGKRADNRPALQQALDAVTADKGILCVYSLSRLARNTKTAIAISERLEKAGADLVSLSERIDNSASGKMVFKMMAVLADFERDQLIERVRCSLTLMKAKNLRTGRIPYGMDCVDGVNLTPNAAEQAVIADMLDMDAKGLSLRDIAKALTLRGIKAKSGRDWHPESVRIVVKRHSLQVAA